MVEVSSLKVVFQQVKLLGSNLGDRTDSLILTVLIRDEGSLSGCFDALKTIEMLISPDVFKHDVSKRPTQDQIRACFDRLKWPSKVLKAKELLEEVMQHKATISLALGVEVLKDITQIKRDLWKLDRAVDEFTTLQSGCMSLVLENGSCTVRNKHSGCIFEHKHLKIVFFVIDALDERKNRESLLYVVHQLATDPRFSKLRILITSREYSEVGEKESPFSSSLSMLHDKMCKSGIDCYITANIASKPNFHRGQWSDNFGFEVQQALSNGAKGMFRWVVCQLDDPERLRNIRRIRAALKELPVTLDKT
ncbi:hypothetical protein QBC36DRAFT_311018 [Triangularia setosa]|uniref:Nephrocystin 3-like N-terminal domain-containing protein n=1 Tax=Triangularia setosa TaxID=2587417 RepID=A0AAN6W7J8_9PEZI|nr:hypothetical protein QBC36DRAFT_311018 [Podospora setosa]